MYSVMFVYLSAGRLKLRPCFHSIFHVRHIEKLREESSLYFRIEMRGYTISTTNIYMALADHLFIN